MNWIEDGLLFEVQAPDVVLCTGAPESGIWAMGRTVEEAKAHWQEVVERWGHLLDLPAPTYDPDTGLIREWIPVFPPNDGGLLP